MAAESNAGFHRDETAMNCHAITFQSGRLNSSSEMIPLGNYYGTTAAAMNFPGDSSIINNSAGIIQVGTSSGTSPLYFDSMQGLKHDTGLAVEWSIQEQYKLEEGLNKYADEPSILRYIKIAATLRDKAVRDVALRCKWMKRKQRKGEEHNSGKKMYNIRKDKLVESPSNMNVPLLLPQNMATYPSMMHHVGQHERFEGLHFTTANLLLVEAMNGISGTSRHLLEQNVQAFSQITSNLSNFKLQDNIDLFCRARNNITTILNDMREMPGIMSRMPPLPLSLNEDLANSLLFSTPQSIIFGSPSTVQPKQEQRDGPPYC